MKFKIKEHIKEREIEWSLHLDDGVIQLLANETRILEIDPCNGYLSRYYINKLLFPEFKLNAGGCISTYDEIRK